jgi:cellulose synthase/poly-beta-1,6-N-acetylglucosamine synthase-like glycosyltransferase
VHEGEGTETVLLSWLFASLIALAFATALLVCLGSRLHVASVPLSALAGLCFVGVVAVGVRMLWHVPWHDAVAGALFVGATIAAVVAARPLWNPVGQLFFATTVAAALSYLLLAGWITISGVLSPIGTVSSACLWVIEAVAFVITGSFAFESCDVVCRARWSRPVPAFDPTHVPKVSLHVPAYAEPPDMLIETISTLEAQNYPNFEIVVVDNNTTDESLWRPVQRYCEDRPRVQFVHVDPWPGFKSGALNLALHRHTAPDAEIIGVVDADYLVSPDYLERTIGYFASPDMAFVQTPQDYREWEGDTYLTACHDSYRYFFETAMPSRNDRNSIIFGGTMGLIRRSVLEEIGGWDEECITEDAEASLRILRAGYSGFYLNQSFGQGIMPLTFAALKRQMFRWCFGGIQILRRHGRSLIPWTRQPSNHLTTAQRMDYLLGGLQWFGNLIGLVFTVVLGLTAATLLTQGHVPFGPLLGAAVLLPLAMLSSGLIRALWALRHQSRISVRRALLAFVSWLSLSWTIALACLQGMTRTSQPFLRTPKWRSEGGFFEALRTTRAESALAAAALLGAFLVGFGSRVGIILVLLFLWQGGVYAASPAMAWLNQRSHLPVRLERLRRAEERRERFGLVRPHVVGAGIGTVILGVGSVLLIGSLSASSGSNRLHLIFTPPSDGASVPGASTNAGPGTGDSPGQSSPQSTASGGASKGSTAINGGGLLDVRSPNSATTSTTSQSAVLNGSPPSSTTTVPVAGVTTTTHPNATTTTHPGATTTTHPGATTTTPSLPSQVTTTTNARRP